GAGLVLTGASGTPTTIDMLTGGTYYTLVDSGAFTVNYATFSNVDEQGVQLSFGGPFSINNSTFDYAGSGAISTSTLFTLNSATNSVITLTGVAYGNNGAAANKYNYTLIGSSTGLTWSNQQFGGALSGDAHERNDTSNLITWQTGNTCQAVNSITTGNW